MNVGLVLENKVTELSKFLLCCIHPTFQLHAEGISTQLVAPGLVPARREILTHWTTASTGGEMCAMEVGMPGLDGQGLGLSPCPHPAKFLSSGCTLLLLQGTK